MLNMLNDVIRNKETGKKKVIKIKQKVNSR